MSIHQPEDLGVLRFITAGSVDDGKSTLIGRLLYDSKAVLSDQLSALSRGQPSRATITSVARAGPNADFPAGAS